MRWSPDLGEEVSPFFGKLAQLNILIEQFNSTLENIMYQKEHLRMLHESELQRLRNCFLDNQNGLMESIKSNVGNVWAKYQKKYRRKVCSLRDDLENHFSEKQSNLGTFVTDSSEALNDMLMVSKQARHGVETAGNALNSQAKLAMRDIERSIKSSKEKFAENIRKHDAELQVQIEKLETEHRKRSRDIETQGNAAKTKATKKLGTMKPKRKPDSSFDASLLHNMRKSVTVMRDSVILIMESYKRRFLDMRQELSGICQKISKYNDKNYIETAVNELERELTRKSEDLKRQNNQVIKEKRVKVGNLELILDMDRNEHWRIIDLKRQELHDVVSHCDLQVAEFEQIQSNELTEFSMTKNRDKADLENMLSHKEHEIAEVRARCENEKQVIVEEAKKDREMKLSELQSLYDNEKKELQNANSIELSNAKMEMQSKISKLQEKVSMRKNELREYQSELEKIKLVSFDEEILPSIDYSDIDELRVNQEHAYAEASKKKEEELAKLQKRMDMELVYTMKKLDANRQSEIAKVEKEMEDPSKEYVDLDNKYREEYANQESILSNIPEINPNDDEFLSKAGRLIENLTHQSYQLKSTMKFQRVALESEWKMKIDAENTHYDEQSIEFAQKHRALQDLFNLQTEVSEQKYKNQQLIMKMKNELGSLELENSEIWTHFERDKVQAMKQEQYDQWTEILSSGTEEANTVISDALAECEAERSSLKSLIEEYEKQRKIEADEMNHFIQESSIQVSELRVKLRGTLSNRIDDVKEETLRNVASHQESLKIMSYQFESTVRDLELKVKVLSKEKKEQESRMFNEYNMQRSSNNMKVENLSRANRVILDELKSKRRAVVDFFDEKIQVMLKARNFFQESYINRGPRPAEQEKISELEKQLRSISKDLGSVTSDFSNVKRIMSVRERVYNHNFGKKPKVGTLTRRSYT